MLQDRLSDLETKREAARAKLAEIGQSSAKAWNDLRNGTPSAREDSDKVLRDVAREFDSGPSPKGSMKGAKNE